MAVESVSGYSWNKCPDQPGITVRMRVEWVSESAWNTQICEQGALSRLVSATERERIIHGSGWGVVLSEQ